MRYLNNVTPIGALTFHFPREEHLNEAVTWFNDLNMTILSPLSKLNNVCHWYWYLAGVNEFKLRSQNEVLS